jgi:hypothetical protein
VNARLRELFADDLVFDGVEREQAPPDRMAPGLEEPEIRRDVGDALQPGPVRGHALNRQRIVRIDPERELLVATGQPLGVEGRQRGDVGREARIGLHPSVVDAAVGRSDGGPEQGVPGRMVERADLTGRRDCGGGELKHYEKNDRINLRKH